MPFLYVTYLTILLLDRAYRDDARCRAKYKSYWDEYCAIVPYKVVPGCRRHGTRRSASSDSADAAPTQAASTNQDQKTEKEIAGSFVNPPWIHSSVHLFLDSARETTWPFLRCAELERLVADTLALSTASHPHQDEFVGVQVFAHHGLDARAFARSQARSRLGDALLERQLRQRPNDRLQLRLLSLRHELTSDVQARHSGAPRSPRAQAAPHGWRTAEGAAVAEALATAEGRVEGAATAAALPAVIATTAEAKPGHLACWECVLESAVVEALLPRCLPTPVTEGHIAWFGLPHIECRTVDDNGTCSDFRMRWRAGCVAPKAGCVAPKAGCVVPKAGCVAVSVEPDTGPRPLHLAPLPGRLSSAI
eukprot:scaffold1992_cov250-Pinguiococcus_pyrenoidosus.AAC.4